ncbi:hypothetical protein CCACVL1_05834 [Corchorus capsularis]|uniref:Uncharacterized protein n=1 Tax=Corchorus capsularis TaxID=210143 RepID=A0A1R3JJ28_COCAP|nr:hypothetical protein CCACVL1_05834 [Corchorus capsularis]
MGKRRKLVSLEKTKTETFNSLERLGPKTANKERHPGQEIVGCLPWVAKPQCRGAG